MSKNHKKHSPICPKCGYDQAGEIATWENQCPMHGRCPECGLEFAWADVLDPARVDLGWYIEHAKTKWEMVKRTGPTLKKLVFPNIFWREVGVETRIRLPILAIWLFLLASFIHLVAAIPVGMGSWREQGYWGSGRGVRKYIEMHGLQCIFDELFNALVSPFARFEYGGGWHQFFWGSFWGGVELITFSVGTMFFGLTGTWFFILLALPDSRSLIQLRKTHLIRAWMMSFLVIVLNFEVSRAIIGFIMWLNGMGNSAIFGFMLLGVVIVSIFWIQWFWIAALKVGWGIRPVWLIALLGTIASLLAGFIPIVYMSVYA